MDSKNLPLLKWNDPGPQEEPEHIKEIVDELGHQDIMPHDLEKNR